MQAKHHKEMYNRTSIAAAHRSQGRSGAFHLQRIREGQGGFHPEEVSSLKCWPKHQHHVIYFHIDNQDVPSKSRAQKSSTALLRVDNKVAMQGNMSLTMLRLSLYVPE